MTDFFSAPNDRCVEQHEGSRRGGGVWIGRQPPRPNHSAGELPAGWWGRGGHISGNLEHAVHATKSMGVGHAVGAPATRLSHKMLHVLLKRCFPGSQPDTPAGCGPVVTTARRRVLAGGS